MSETPSNPRETRRIWLYGTACALLGLGYIAFLWLRNPDWEVAGKPDTAAARTLTQQLKDESQRKSDRFFAERRAAFQADIDSHYEHLQAHIAAGDLVRARSALTDFAWNGQLDFKDVRALKQRVEQMERDLAPTSSAGGSGAREFGRAEVGVAAPETPAAAAAAPSGP